MTNVAEALKRSKSWMWSRRLRFTLLISVLVLTAPWPASGQADGPCCAILVSGSIKHRQFTAEHCSFPERDSRRGSGHVALRADGGLAD